MNEQMIEKTEGALACVVELTDEALEGVVANGQGQPTNILLFGCSRSPVRGADRQ